MSSQVKTSKTQSRKTKSAKQEIAQQEPEKEEIVKQSAEQEISSEIAERSKAEPEIVSETKPKRGRGRKSVKQEIVQPEPAEPEKASEKASEKEKVEEIVKQTVEENMVKHESISAEVSSDDNSIKEISEKSKKQTRAKSVDGIKRMKTSTGEIKIGCLTNFLNHIYKSSELADYILVHFKPYFAKKELLKQKSDEKKSRKLNASLTIDLEKCGCLEEFDNILHTYEGKDGKALKLSELKNYIFDFSLRGAFDIFTTYAENTVKTDNHDENSILTDTIINSVGLPHYRPISIRELHDIVNQYFEKKLYLIKLINQIYPHATREKGLARDTVNKVYIQHIPDRALEILEMMANGKTSDEILHDITEEIVNQSGFSDEVNKLFMNQKILGELLEYREKIFEPNKFFNWTTVEKILGKKFQNNKEKKPIKTAFYNTFREVSRIRTFCEQVVSGMNAELRDDSEYRKFFDELSEKIKQFDRFYEEKEYPITINGFSQYFVDTLNLCYSMFEIPIEKRRDYFRYFIKLVDPYKRIQVSDKTRRGLVTGEETEQLIKLCNADVEKIVSSKPFTTAELQKFLVQFGKSCVKLSATDRNSRFMYIAIGLVVLQYTQQKIAMILNDKSKTKELTIYIGQHITF